MTEEISLKQLGKIVRQRLNNQWDFNCAVSGTPGAGKSTFTVLLCKKIDKLYQLDKNVAFYPRPQDIIPQYESLKPKQAFHIDETTRAIHKHQWHNPILQKLSKHYDTERYQTKATVFCIPRFWNLTENFRNDRIMMWIHVLDRGVASVNIRDDDKYQFDPWHLKQNMKIRSHYKMRSVISQTVDDKIKLESKNPNFVGIVRFEDLDPETKTAYENAKIASRKAIDTEEEEKEIMTKDKERLYSGFRWDVLAGMTKEQLAKKYIYTESYIYELCKRLGIKLKKSD